jgi:phosphate:Na+ symporter
VTGTRSDAARETLRMGDFVETMLRDVMNALMTNSRGLVAEVSRTDNVVDRLDEAIKLYVTKLTAAGSASARDGTTICDASRRDLCSRSCR